MTTVTLHADEGVVSRATEAARKRQLSLEAILNEALMSIAGNADTGIGLAVERLRQQKMMTAGEGAWTREERNYRGTKFDAEWELLEAAADKGNCYLDAVREAGLYYTGGPFTRDELNER